MKKLDQEDLQFAFPVFLKISRSRQNEADIRITALCGCFAGSAGCKVG